MSEKCGIELAKQEMAQVQLERAWVEYRQVMEAILLKNEEISAAATRRYEAERAVSALEGERRALGEKSACAQEKIRRALGLTPDRAHVECDRP